MALNTDNATGPTTGNTLQKSLSQLSGLSWALLSFFVLVALWHLAAVVVQDPITLPSPLDVVNTLWEEAASGELFVHVWATLLRVIISFAIAMLLGTAIGIGLGRSQLSDQFFGNWLLFFLNLPALVTIVLCYVWLGQNDLAAILAVTINKIPNVAIVLREGTRSLSRDLDEMALVYKFGFWKTFRNVTLPQLAPFLSAAARSGLSLVWKIVLVVELFGLQEGVGVQIHQAFTDFEVDKILAYAIAFIAVVQVIEMCILQPIDKWVNRWRR